MTDDEIVQELIASCRRHLTPSEAVFVRACLINHRGQMLLHIRSQRGTYTDEAMARLALKCAERVAGSAAN